MLSDVLSEIALCEPLAGRRDGPDVLLQCIVWVRGDRNTHMFGAVVEIRYDEPVRRDIREALLDACRSLLLRWLLNLTTLLVGMRIVAYDMETGIRVAKTVIFPQGFHALALIRDAICGVLKFVTLEQYVSKRHRDDKVYPRTPSSCKRIDFDNALSREIDRQR